jgi:hypothetical protein
LSIFTHHHGYEAIAVEHREKPVAFQGTTTSTVILWRCRCADVCSQEIEGKWTLAQVRGEREMTPRERVEADLIVATATGGKS